MNTDSNLTQELPQKTHEKFLHSVAHATPPNLIPEHRNVTWWPSEAIGELFKLGPCVGPLCVATRKSDDVTGSIFYDSEHLVYYDFVPAAVDETNHQVNNDD